MANFNETQIQTMIKHLRDEFGPDTATRELAILELEDMKRKGCVLDFDNRYDECRFCPSALNCPILTWEKRHPEYANDELAMKIKALENKSYVQQSKTHDTISFPEMTVGELIEKLKQLPPESKTGRLEVKTLKN